MRQKIENTQAFQNLSALQKSIYSKRKVMLEIEQQYNVAKNTTREQWLKDFQPVEIYKNIIDELLNSNE